MNVAAVLGDLKRICVSFGNVGPLGSTAQEDGHRKAELGLQGSFNGFTTDLTRVNDVAALNISLHPLQTQRLEHGAQGGHRQVPMAADIDAAKQGDTA